MDMPQEVSRRQLWSDAVNADTQELIDQAVTYRELINTATTNTKKKYYQKKFKKLQEQLISNLLVQQRLQAQIDADAQAVHELRTAEDVPE